MIHINLNMIFYTHVEHSPTETIYIKYYKKQNKNKYIYKLPHKTLCVHSAMLMFTVLFVAPLVDHKANVSE